jgi:hypothetical protein
MFGFLRRWFGKTHRDTPRYDNAGLASPLSDDPELNTILEKREREVLQSIRNAQAAEALAEASEALAEASLTSQERIKKRLNLPSKLPADYRADESVPRSVISFSYLRRNSAVPTIMVVCNSGVGIIIPRVLFEYLYQQKTLTWEDRQVINQALVQMGQGPEAL